MDKFMQEAYKEAKKALVKEEVPVGAVIVKNNKIIAKAHNLRETKNNALAHAEILCINKACKKLKNWRLEECTMYVTLYPCNMCIGAINQSRINKVFYAVKDDKIKCIEDDTFMYIEDENCKEILQNFFKQLRRK